MKDGARATLALAFENGNVTPAEADLLEAVLVEARHSAAIRTPVHMTIDPWTNGDGAYLHISYDLAGIQYEIDGKIRKRSRPTTTAKLSRGNAAGLARLAKSKASRLTEAGKLTLRRERSSAGKVARSSTYGLEGAVEAGPFMRASLGKNLLAAREHAGLTQVELAQFIRSSTSAVDSAEKGTRTVGVRYVEKVLKACGLPKDWKPSK